MMTMMVAMINADGRTLESIVGRDLYQRLTVAAATLGLPEIALRQYKPWAVATLLSMPPSRTGQFLDLVLYQRALVAGVELVGLETVEEQLRLFEELSEADQVVLLKDVVDSFPDIPKLHEQLLSIYLRRDLAGLVQLNEDLAKGSESATMKRFQKKLIEERNVRMAERMEGYMIDGLFVAVGALHLPGPKGILNLLQLKGYKVQRVY